VKRVALAAAISLATFTVAALLWRFRDAAILLALSVVLAAAARPAIEGLEQRVGRSVAVALSYVLGLTLFGVFAYLVSRGVLHELDAAAEQLSAAYDRLRLQAGASRAFPALLIGRLPPAAALYHAIGGARPTLLLDQALGLTRNTIDVAARIIVVVAISAYWSTSREAFERLWLSLVPAPQRPRARDVWRGVERAVGSHVRGELAVSVLSALLLAVVFRLAYLPLPMLPALAAGVLRLIPFFVVPTAAAAAFLAGSSVSIAVGAASAGVTVVVMVAVDQIVGRRLLEARRPSQTLTVLMVVALVDAYGVIGLVFASTLAMAIEACVEPTSGCNNFMNDRSDRTSKIVALLRERVRLGPLHRRLFYVSFGILWGSGALWVLIQWFKDPELGAARTLLQTFAMKIHGAAMLIFLAMLGTLFTHVRRGWILRANRLSGCFNIAINVLLAVTGWLLYYIPDDSTREWASFVHWSIGLAALPLLSVHTWFGRAASDRKMNEDDQALKSPHRPKRINQYRL